MVFCKTRRAKDRNAWSYKMKGAKSFDELRKHLPRKTQFIHPAFGPFEVHMFFGRNNGGGAGFYFCSRHALKLGKRLRRFADVLLKESNFFKPSCCVLFTIHNATSLSSRRRRDLRGLRYKVVMGF